MFVQIEVTQDHLGEGGKWMDKGDVITVTETRATMMEKNGTGKRVGPSHDAPADQSFRRSYTPGPEGERVIYLTKRIPTWPSGRNPAPAADVAPPVDTKQAQEPAADQANPAQDGRSDGGQGLAQAQAAAGGKKGRHRFSRNG